jgi:hypothetical protein
LRCGHSMHVELSNFPNRLEGQPDPTRERLSRWQATLRNGDDLIMFLTLAKSVNKICQV